MYPVLSRLLIHTLALSLSAVGMETLGPSVVCQVCRGSEGKVIMKKLVNAGTKRN